LRIGHLPITVTVQVCPVIDNHSQSPMRSR
jgi:hypothetical protein